MPGNRFTSEKCVSRFGKNCFVQLVQIARLLTHDVCFGACGTMRNSFVTSCVWFDPSRSSLRVFVIRLFSFSRWWIPWFVRCACVRLVRGLFFLKIRSVSVSVYLYIYIYVRSENGGALLLYQSQYLLGRCFSQKSHFTTEETLEPSTTGIKIVAKQNDNTQHSTNSIVIGSVAHTERARVRGREREHRGTGTGTGKQSYYILRAW